MWYESDYETPCASEWTFYDFIRWRHRLWAAKRPFDLSTLQSETLVRLQDELRALKSGVRIEVIFSKRTRRGEEKHPSWIVGLPIGEPTIQFVDSLNRDDRIEAIAHELVHLVLVYRFGLGVVGQRLPRFENSHEALEHLQKMGRNWDFLLSQTTNTVHHLILVRYLKEKYGIESTLHRRLLHQSLWLNVREYEGDRESSFANGLIAFEYNKLIGNSERPIRLFPQTEFFWKAYCSAEKHFGKYDLHSVPSPSIYAEDILSFLEDLGYPRGAFLFFPEIALDSERRTKALAGLE